MAGYGHARIFFPIDSINPQVDSVGLAFNLESAVAVAAKKNGDLLFYSNGCEIANRNHVVMPNGQGLNPGSIADEVCPWKGYILPQSAMVLPDPSNAERYMLLHMGASYSPENGMRRTQLYYSMIDMTLNQGLGDVVSKNNILLSGDLGAFTGVRHGNGRDWWIIIPEFGNQVWHTFLLSPGGIEAMPAQQLSIGQLGCRHQEACTASKDGSRIASWGDCKVSVLDFDRCDGALSASLDIQTPTHLIPGGGLAFSPSGRYLYVCSQTVLYRADMSATAPELDTIRFSYDPYLQSPFDVPGNTFHYLVNVPGGNMYASSPSRRRYLHVLKKTESPTQSGVSFVPQGLALPVVSVRTLPHFPNYQLYDLPGSPCDTLGINGNSNTHDLTGSPGFSLAPNPAHDLLQLNLPAGGLKNAQILLTDATGKCLQISEFNRTEHQLLIPIAQFPPGLYCLGIRSEDVVWAGKFLKQ
jgi:hypothetical protein